MLMMEDVDLFKESGYESPTKKPRTLNTSESITIKDNVHGHILVPPLCRMIMDTREFARYVVGWSVYLSECSSLG